MKTILHKLVIVICVFTLLLASILFTACTPATPVNDPPVSTPTPEVFNPIDPSPTPINSDLPLACQVTDLKVYVSKAAGYCFAYPDRFTVSNQPSDLPLLQAPAVNSSGVGNASLKIDITPFDVNKSLDQHVDEFIQGFTVINPAYFEHAQIRLGGEFGILVERARVMVNNEPAPAPTQMSWRMIFVQHAGYPYRLMYWPVDSAEVKSDLDELYQVTTGSFAFLNLDPSFPLADPAITATSTPVPTYTPIPFTPTASLPCDWISFVTDVTVPDGTAFNPSASFVKTWRLKNIGSCTWTPAYSLVFVSGDRMGGASAVALPGNVAPGATVDVSVNLTAPTAVNSYTGYWKLRNASGVLFGLGANASGAFLVNINVVCQFTGLKVYTDKSNRFCFGYPNRFKANGQSSGLPQLQGPAVDASGEVYANLKIEVTSFDFNKSLDQQVDEFLQGFTVINPANFEHTRVIVGGESAILVERARINESDGPVQMNWRIVFIPHGSSLYRFIYRPMDVTEALADLNELYQVITVTFTFIK
jgi:hypothetical protein